MKNKKSKINQVIAGEDKKIPPYITASDVLAVIRAEYYENYNPVTPEEEQDFTNWWDVTCSPMLIKFLARGDGIAMYKNQVMDSSEFGRVVCMSFGSAEAQIELPIPPDKMPDPGICSTPWAYTLVDKFELPKGEI